MSGGWPDTPGLEKEVKRQVKLLEAQEKKMMRTREENAEDEMAEAKARDLRRFIIKNLWANHGGSWHGPHVEHATIPEDGFWSFVDDLIEGIENGSL